MSKDQVHLEPRLSLLPFVTYLDAKVTQRKQILIAQKFPPEAIPQIYYREALEKTGELLVRSVQGEDPQFVYEELYACRADSWRKAQAAWEKKIVVKNYEAFARFKKLLLGKILALDNLKIIPMAADFESSIRIGKVQLSIRPEFQIEYGLRQRYAGFLKLNFSSDKAQSKDSAKNVGLLVKKYADEFMGELDHRGFLFADVPTGELHVCPATGVLRLRKAELACEEIFSRWPMLEKPKKLEKPRGGGF